VPNFNVASLTADTENGRRRGRGRNRTRSRTRSSWVQLGLSARGSRGGYRAGAGRPRGRTAVAHLRRPRLSRHTPVHCTLRLRDDLPSLRRHHLWDALRVRFRAGCDRFGFRLVDFSVQSNHIHIICEGNDRRALSRGMQGLAIRLARCINKRLGRTGKVFAERYHAQQLPTPTETRNALVYVLGNHARHANIPPGLVLDVFSSAPYLVRARMRIPIVPEPEPLTTSPRSYLLATARARLA
jgi:REP element-mobilizing transposase RayT